jgi:uncharacterized membrane protein
MSAIYTISPARGKPLAASHPTKYHAIAMSASRWLILILLFATGLRLHALGRASFWYDEFGSLEASTGRGLAHLQLPLNQFLPTPPPHLTSLPSAPPIWRIWTSLDLDNHPPLYFMLLRITRDALGDAEWAVRLPSAICSLIVLVFFFLIVRMQLGDTAALAATALLAVAGSQITLAQETRPYMLWLALSLACGWILLRIERLGMSSSRWIAFCLLCWAAFLTHYLTAAIFVSLFIYAAIQLRGPRRAGALTALITAATLFAASWGIFFMRQLHSASSNNAWQLDDSPHHLPRIFWHLIQLPALWLSEPTANFTPAAILIFLGCGYAIIHCRRKPGIWFWILWATPLILLITATDLARHAQSLFFMRYTFAAAPALCFSVGALVQTYRRAWLLPVTLGLLCLCTLPAAYSTVMDWRNVAADLQSHVQPGDTIIFTPGANAASWSQTAFLGISHYAPHLPASVLILTDPQAPVLSEALHSGHFVWVICTDQTIPPNALDPAARIMRTGIAPSMGRVSELAP